MSNCLTNARSRRPPAWSALSSLAWIVLVLSALSGCASAPELPSGAHPVPLASDDTAAVYAAVLASAFPASAERQVVVLAQIKDVEPDMFGDTLDADERWRDLLAEQARVSYVAFEPTDPNMVLMTSAEWHQLIVGRGAQGWADFRGRYPRAEGIVQLSAVGFDASSQSALVLAVIDSERRMSGRLYAIDKVGDKWIVSEHVFGTAGAP